MLKDFSIKPHGLALGANKNLKGFDTFSDNLKCLITNIDGHGVGVGGGAPMHDEQKLPDTRRKKKQGGWAQGCEAPREKNFLTPW